MNTQQDQASVTSLAARRIAKARTQLLLNPKFIFWATCALHLRLVPYLNMANEQMGPIGTDGDNLYYDPDFLVNGMVLPDGRQIGPWTDEEMMGVIAHEVSHAVKGDCWRRGQRELALWNIAADMRINSELIKAGLTLPKMPPQMVDPRNFGRSAEEIYAAMPHRGQGQQGGERSEPEPGIGQDIRDIGQGKGKAETEEAASAASSRWEIIGRQAAQLAQAQGTLPAGYYHLVTPVRVKLDPWAMLRHFVQMCRKDDYSWARANRRVAWRGLYLPSLWSEGVGEILIGIDTSGSTAGVVPKFLGFLKAVLEEVRPERVWLVECDAAVHAVTEFPEGEGLPDRVAIHGLGGTSMRPIWDWAAKTGVMPVCAIILTDLQMTSRDCGEPQPWPTLWVTSTPGTVAPWGETVELE